MNSPDWVIDIEGSFPLHKAVVEVMPPGTKVLLATPYGVSAWAKTAKVCVVLADKSPKAYFLKCATGPSAVAINAVVPNLDPHAIGWGQYTSSPTSPFSLTFFFLTTHHHLTFTPPPPPSALFPLLTTLHTHSISPTTHFGFPVPTVLGKYPHTTTWTPNWTTAYTALLHDVLAYTAAALPPWPAFSTATTHLLSTVLPRLLNPLQSHGRHLKPALIHGDLWEQNIGVDAATGRVLLFDPGCLYAHAEMEFGTWRASWAHWVIEPEYLERYKRDVGVDEPVGEWDDRNRVYALHAVLNDAAGRGGEGARVRAYNDILYLCEKYAPWEGMERYKPELDVSVTGRYERHLTQVMRDEYLSKGVEE